MYADDQKSPPGVLSICVFHMHVIWYLILVTCSATNIEDEAQVTVFQRKEPKEIQ
jgi:hypothetical protein